MPTTLVSTGIKFPDGTIQTTVSLAGPQGPAGSVATYGQVGSYTVAAGLEGIMYTPTEIGVGVIVGGARLMYRADGVNGGKAVGLVGSWMAMSGVTHDANNNAEALFLRIA